MFEGSKPPKFHGSPNIFLTKYQLSVFWCLLFAEKINLLLVNQEIFSLLKLVLRSWKKSKQNLVENNIWWYTKFWWFRSHEWVINCLKLEKITPNLIVQKCSKINEIHINLQLFDWLVFLKLVIIRMRLLRIDHCGFFCIMYFFCKIMILLYTVSVYLPLCWEGFFSLFLMRLDGF